MTRSWQRAEVGGSPRLMRLPAVHGSIAPRGDSPVLRRVYYLFPLNVLEIEYEDGLVTDRSHVYVRKLKFYNLGAWLGTPGPGGTVGRA